jgi:hypothetical protein
MPTYSLTLRNGHEGRLSVEEMDNNLLYLQQLVTTIDITYSELYSAIINSGLTPGATYRLTDYKSVNFLNGWSLADNNPTPIESSFNPREVYVGDEEVLILTAISDSELSPIAYSEAYPGDIIEYQAYTNKIGLNVDIYNGSEVAGLIGPVSGFDLQWDGTNVYFDLPNFYPALYGHYFYIYAEFDGGNYYQDGAFEPLRPGINICQYPYSTDNELTSYPKEMSRVQVVNNGLKVLLLDLTQQDYNNYDLDTLSVSMVYAIDDAYGWVVRRNDTERSIDVPFDFRARKYRRYQVDLSGLGDFGIDYFGIGDNYLDQGTTGNYLDFYCFGNGSDVFNIKWNGMGGPNLNWYSGYSDNVVILNDFYKNIVEGFFYNNTFVTCSGNTFKESNYNNIFFGFNKNEVGFNFSNNILGLGYFNNNKIGDDFRSNKIGYSFTNNKVGNSFQNNIISTYFTNNVIDGDFNGNTIGSSFYGNTIGSSFYGNTIGSVFRYNKTSYSFNNNTIGNYFQFSTIASEFGGNTIGADFAYNAIGDNFGSNIIGNNFQSNTIKAASVTIYNFSTASHVYQSYNCDIFKNSSGALRLSYIDGSDVIQYTSITA